MPASALAVGAPLVCLSPQHLDSTAKPHSFAIGIASAARSFVDAVCSPGGGAAACTVEQLWNASAGMIFDEGRKWQTRRAALLLIVLPLLHTVSADQVPSLLTKFMPQIFNALKSMKQVDKAPLPTEREVHLSLSEC